MNKTLESKLALKAAKFILIPSIIFFSFDLIANFVKANSGIISLHETLNNAIGKLLAILFLTTLAYWIAFVCVKIALLFATRKK